MTSPTRPTEGLAGDFIPLGIHATPQGRIAFDQPDDELIEDVRTLLACCAALGDAPTNPVTNLKGQQKTLGMILWAVLQEMGAPDGGEPLEPSKLLASAFARFPQFVDFRGLVVDSGDALTDPNHPDAALVAQVEAGFGRGRGKTW